LQMEARALRLADTERYSKTLSTIQTYSARKALLKEFDNELTSAFTDLLDAFVTNRLAFRTNNVDVLYLNWGIGDLVSHMGGDISPPAKEALQKRFYTEYTAQLAAKDNELAHAMAVAKDLETFEKQKEYLQTKQTYDHNVFAQLFIFGFKNYSREQALEIKPLLENYKKGLPPFQARIAAPWVDPVEADVDKILNPSPEPPPAPNRIALASNNPVPSAGQIYSPARPYGPRVGGAVPNLSIEPPGPEPLVSSNVIIVKTFYPLPMDDLPGDKPERFKVINHQLIEGKLLLDFQYEAWVYTFDQNGNWKSSAAKTFSGLALFDPKSSHWQVKALPDHPSSLNSTLWRGELYSCSDGKIQKFDWDKNTWHTNALPVSGDFQLYNLNDKFYIADINSIQQITEDSRGTKLLASTQRRPAVSSLDSQGGLMNLLLFTDAQSNLCAGVHNKVYRWVGTDWREIGEVPTSTRPSVFDGGILFMTDGRNALGQISCFDTRSGIIETCLFPASQRPGGRLPDVLPKPLWKLPMELVPQQVSVAYCQSNLFLMADHSGKQDIVVEEHGSFPDGTFETNHIIVGQKILLKDGYNSALYCFSRGRAAAEKLLLKFDNHEGCPPMAGLGSNSIPWMTQIAATESWMLFTPEFLLCGRDDVPGSSEPDHFKPGVWVVQMDSIMPKIVSLQQMQPDRKSSK
jgi:hypothetical protein